MICKTSFWKANNCHKIILKRSRRMGKQLYEDLAFSRPKSALNKASVSEVAL